MVIKEHDIGHGTIAYKGESADYWRAKSERLQRGRAKITRALLIAGAVVALLALSPLGPHLATAKVLAVHPSVRTGVASTVELSVAGRSEVLSAQVPPVTEQADPVPGSLVDITTLPGGRASLGRRLFYDAWALAGLLLLVGAGRLVWQVTHRGQVIRFR